MFIDDFPPELFDKVVEFLESENSWILEEEVEMSLETMFTENPWRIHWMMRNNVYRD